MFSILENAGKPCKQREECEKVPQAQGFVWMGLPAVVPFFETESNKIFYASY